MRQVDTTPMGWEDCFEKIVNVKNKQGEEFAFYTSGLTEEETPVLLLLHGGGCTGLSFAAMAKRLKGHMPLVAMDQRCHGETKAEGELDIDTLVRDVVEVTGCLFEGALGRAGVPPLVLCGHSVGGSVAARVAAHGGLPVVATVLIDVTEGTALEALPHMGAWVAGRPASFATRGDAVRYVCARGHVRSLASARRSVPAQLAPAGARWAWRTDLAATRPHWRAWFSGLSAVFLAFPGPKLLILAGVDRLDRALTIAQMQGRFQNILIPDAGHTVHEDQPDKTAAAILDFLRRNLIVPNGLKQDSVLPPVFQQRNPVL